MSFVLPCSIVQRILVLWCIYKCYNRKWVAMDRYRLRNPDTFVESTISLGKMLENHKRKEKKTNKYDPALFSLLAYSGAEWLFGYQCRWAAAATTKIKTTATATASNKQRREKNSLEIEINTLKLKQFLFHVILLFFFFRFFFPFSARSLPVHFIARHPLQHTYKS